MIICDHCDHFIKFKKGDEYVCPECHEPLELGAEYKLIAHDRRDGKPRSRLHNSIHTGARCFIIKSDLPIQFSNRGHFYAEYGDDDNYLHGVNTSDIEDVSDDGEILTITTLNTVYKFQKQ